MTDDNPAGALDGRASASQTSPLTVLAWIATGLYVLVVALLLITGVAAKTSHESAAMFAMAVVAGIPLAIMLAVMDTAAGRRSTAGRWICIVLGAVSFLLLILLITS